MPRSTSGNAQAYRHLQLGACGVFISLFALSACSWAQPALQEVAEPTEQQDAPEVSTQFLQAQIERLDAKSFRDRQLAAWRLSQHPLATMQLIEESMKTLDPNVAAQLIDLLSALAVHSDVSVSVKAQRLLKSIADDTTFTGKLANNTLSAIADLQEEKAIEILTRHGATIGRQSIPVNGRVRSAPFVWLLIDEQFKDAEDAVQAIGFLKSVEAVYFTGEAIDSRYFEALSQLSEIRVIKLKHISMGIDDLTHFAGLMKLEHLGLNYIEIDDEAVPHLLQLPVSQSMRLYGTRISNTGAKRLEDQLDGIEVFVGKGGFLGIGTHTAFNTVISTVTPGSAAQEAGIQPADRLLEIDGTEVNTFDDIRDQLAKSEAGEEVEIVLERVTPQGKVRQTVVATLQEDPN